MDNRGFANIESKVTFVQSGAISSCEDFAQPFCRELAARFDKAGLRTDWDDDQEPTFDVPAGLFPERRAFHPTMVLGVDDALIVGFCIFVGKSAAGAAIAIVLGEVYRGAVRPAVENLWNRINGQKNPPRLTLVREEYWFDDFRKLLRIEIELTARPRRKAMPGGKLVDRALEQARQLIEQGAVNTDVIGYRIAGGRLTGPEFLTAPAA